MKRNFIQVPSYLDYLVERGDDGRRRADRGTANLSGRPKGYFFRESHIHWPMVVLRDFRNAHPDVDLHCVNVASPVFCRRTLKGCAKMISGSDCVASLLHIISRLSFVAISCVIAFGAPWSHVHATRNVAWVTKLVLPLIMPWRSNSGQPRRPRVRPSPPSMGCLPALKISK